MEYSEEIRCPKCDSNQLTSNQKGFSAGKAIGGAFLTGGVGLLAGFIGSKKVLITCLKCGKSFKAGEGKIVRIPMNANNSFETYSSGKPKAIVGEVNRLLTTIEEIKNAPIVWSEKQLIARNKKGLTPEELERLHTYVDVDKKLTPEELDLNEKLELERERKRIEYKKEAKLGENNEQRTNRVMYLTFAIFVASLPLFYLFYKAFNSDFGFFFFVLFMLGLIITGFIFKLIWDLTE